MRYVGGKSKLSKSISEAVLSNTTEREWYLEPFVGGGSIFAKIAPHFRGAIGSDLDPNIVALWRGVTTEGFIPPEVVTEKEYAALRTAAPSALRGYVGFGGSFGGKWFGGYARGGFGSDGQPRNHQGESARAIMRIASALSDVDTDFSVTSYDRHRPSTGDVVYCDPPYDQTQGYAVGEFDSARFWSIMDEWVELGAKVFVSEYSAPAHWPTIWEMPHRQSLTMPIQGRGVTVERLFHRSID